MPTRGILTIDLGAIVANWRGLDARSGQAETAAVVKSNAYGLGIDKVGPVLASAGVKTFFVAQTEEAVRLRKVLAAASPGDDDLFSNSPDIYVLNGLVDEEVALFDAYRLRPVLNSFDQIDRASHWAKSRSEPPVVAIHIDTGMNRLGLTKRDVLHLSEKPQVCSDLDIALLMSHLASADDIRSPMNASQKAVFSARCGISRRFAPQARRSLSATGGALLGRPYAFEMVRPGVGLFGGKPFGEAHPVVRLELPILQVRDIPSGDTVGYGAAWRAERHSRVATVAAGYADGLHRALSNTGVLYIDGRPAPITGRVSMDLISIDVTDFPQARPDTMAEAIGPNQPIDRLAEAAGTIGYEVLTSLGDRFERRYLRAR